MEESLVPERSFSQAKKLLCRALDLSESANLENAAIDSLAEWTSLKHISVVEELESTLGRKLKIDEMLAITSLDAIAELLFEQSRRNQNILD